MFLDNTAELSSFDLHIYKYILDHSDQVIYMRIRDLAAATHTSTASILRFCKKMKCSGFSEFKVKLQLSLAEKPIEPVADVDEMSYMDFLTRARQSSFKKKIQEAVDLLKDKELVVFLGSGSSESIAQYGSTYFSNLFTLALRIEDPSNYPIEFLAKKFSNKICLIALSVSGETQEVINYLKHLNTSHCQVISITNSENSTIAQLSDVNIPYYINRETVKKDQNHPEKTLELTSQLPAVYTIEAIAKAVRKTLVAES
ncbi:MurR/RpiR family transcriptional regulator [Carnobacterium maltaromaticum]|uniref:MurR/RpiR family transcriptional regulator n=1 Tax=Carnobacterium TaxID=2747 RepID=UPI00191B9E99|nr:MurR/RpiR family transcriptional regulator [Carnobacterium maltaromaticum]MDW5525398.1 MurR/RpiR family transcriptional regulator [Carnobacterium maltaromaticum]CAD5898113.1 Helix-turn-helix domain, rpiR family protein [Carnobacterium maltaromaticum]CAD5901620.1 Helix-turn-helix domain, rpiR family protein [Carnobacterium maltaromaticum]